MPIQIQLRRDTAANWTSANPILAQGEMGLETDTGKFKVGNGSSTWSTLVYASGIQGIEGHQGTTGTQGLTGLQGLTGFQGTTGSTGPQGTTGTQGTTGLQGTTGTQGTTGFQGTTGTQGTTGLQGLQGLQGTTGTQGTTGSTVDLGSNSSLVSSLAISNTETNVVYATIAANTLSAGSTYLVTAYGARTTGTNTGSATFNVRIGTTTSATAGNIAAAHTMAVTNTAAPVNFLFRALITVRTTGATGTALGSTETIWNNATILQTNTTTAVTVDTTATNYIKFTFNSGTASNTYTFYVANITEVY